MKRPFLLIPRGLVWYYKLPDETAYHTTHLQHTRKSDRDTAAAWVQNLITRPAPADLTLADFAADFYRWPDSPFIKRQHAKGRSFGKAHAEMCQGYLDHWILPTFGKRRLSTLTKMEIDQWVIGVPLANSTRNHIIYALSTILQGAVDAHLLAVSPLARVEPLGATFRPRDVFSVADYRLLFPQDGLEEVWGSRYKGMLFLLLAGTGIRSGEARALTWRQYLQSERALLIDQTCVGGSLQVGPVSMKKGGARIVLTPSRIHAELEKWR